MFTTCHSGEGGGGEGGGGEGGGEGGGGVGGGGAVGGLPGGEKARQPQSEQSVPYEHVAEVEPSEPSSQISLKADGHESSHQPGGEGGGEGGGGEGGGEGGGGEGGGEGESTTRMYRSKLASDVANDVVQEVDSWHPPTLERNSKDTHVASASQRAAHPGTVSPLVMPSSLRPSQPRPCSSR